MDGVVQPVRGEKRKRREEGREEEREKGGEGREEGESHVSQQCLTV